ncbi:unnamed protein product [Acanthosepion pharaonis]|uniref:Uncharacterized protein n=1 Tax=Acanthosepion pharaonis TaxID=158019 RepID=A0A812BX70_ACAPH|nr:unnamed protein product [Sepia pharaonis]
MTLSLFVFYLSFLSYTSYSLFLSFSRFLYLFHSRFITLGSFFDLSLSSFPFSPSLDFPHSFSLSLTRCILSLSLSLCRSGLPLCFLSLLILSLSLSLCSPLFISLSLWLLSSFLFISHLALSLFLSPPSLSLARLSSFTCIFLFILHLFHFLLLYRCLPLSFFRFALFSTLYCRLSSTFSSHIPQSLSLSLCFCLSLQSAASLPLLSAVLFSTFDHSSLCFFSEYIFSLFTDFPLSPSFFLSFFLSFFFLSFSAIIFLSSFSLTYNYLYFFLPLSPPLSLYRFIFVLFFSLLYSLSRCILLTLFAMLSLIFLSSTLIFFFISLYSFGISFSLLFFQPSPTCFLISNSFCLLISCIFNSTSLYLFFTILPLTNCTYFSLPHCLSLIL